jgi:hypothetical protein
LNKPLCVLPGTSFFIEGLLDEPLFLLRGASFFIRGLLNEPLCILRGASFFIGGFSNEPMNEGSDSALLFMALMVCVKRLSNFQLTSLAVSTLV